MKLDLMKLYLEFSFVQEIHYDFDYYSSRGIKFERRKKNQKDPLIEDEDEEDYSNHWDRSKFEKELWRMRIEEYIQHQYHDLKKQGLSNQQIAYELGISRMTLYRWKCKGLFTE